MPSTPAGDLAGRAVQEVLDLHVLLQAWFRAEGPDDLAAVMAHFDEGFTMVTTAGTLLRYADAVAGFRAGRGTRPGLVMAISDAVVGWHGPGATLVRYVERQSRDGTSNLRRATALLLHLPGRASPAWAHLQETWVEGAA